MAGAFAGIRILDLSRLLPGPYCSLLFADLGADVIKVEEPGRGDYARKTAPLVGGGEGQPAVGAYFLLLNRNKKPTDAQIKDALTGLKCRCGTHMGIMRAVKRASEMMG